MNKVIVNNSRRVSKILGFKVNFEDDLLNIKECDDFIKENKYFLESTDKEIYKIFFNKTGLNITNIYVSESNPEIIYFNKLGSSVDNPLTNNIYNHDLLILNKVDSIEIIDDKIYVNNKSIYTLNKDNYELFKRECIIRNRLSIRNTIKEQLKIINMEYPQYKLNLNEIKQIYLNSFGDLFILKYNGNLYCNNQKYEENVEWIWSVDSYTAYLIFKDNNVEYLTSRYSQFDIQTYDKVLYGNNFLALLKNKKLKLIIIDELPDTSIYQIYNGVDDITFTNQGDNYNNDEFLSLHVGKEKIDINICSIWVEE